MAYILVKTMIPLSDLSHIPTPNLERRMSEGKSASWHSRVCDEGWAKDKRRFSEGWAKDKTHRRI